MVVGIIMMRIHRIVSELVLHTYAGGSCVGRVFSGVYVFVCLSVCFST